MKDSNKYRILFIVALMLEDLIILNGLFVFFSVFKQLVDMSLEQCQVLLVYVNLGYLVSTIFYPVRVDGPNMTVGRVVRNAFVRVLITMSIAVGCMFLTKISGQISRAFVILYSVSFFVVMAAFNYLSKFIIQRYIQRTELHSKAIILGGGALGDKIYKAIRRDPFQGIEVLGFFDDDPRKRRGQLLGGMDQVEQYALSHEVKVVYCTLPVSARHRILELIDFCESNVIQFHIVPALSQYIDQPMVLETIGDVPILSIRKVPLAYAHNAYIKRSFDLAVSLLFLITLFPVIFLIVGLAVKLTSPGPVFFRQERTGRDGKNFYCYKFRSMRVNINCDELQATANDNRKTPIGDFLRRTSIDELPQFINVMKGEMSIVGPRPHMKYHTSEYSHKVDKYMVRHFIKPGITGLAQVTGYRGETREVGMMEGRIKRDIWYIEHWSLLLDVQIIIKTVLQAFKGDSKAY